MVRENSEGEYVDNGGTLAGGTPDEMAIQSAVHTRRGIERILRFAFHLASTRRRRLAMITKSNAQRHAYGLWDRVLAEMMPEFAGVAVEKLHIDAATLHLVRRPETFDVIVGSNLFGDILSDLTGGITGSLGLNPSANLDPERSYPSLFEPVHGSAPDIAGKGIANPAGAILSAAMMLDWLGQEQAAAAIRRAVEQAFADGNLTPDLGGMLDYGGTDGGDCRGRGTVRVVPETPGSGVGIEARLCKRGKAVPSVFDSSLARDALPLGIPFFGLPASLSNRSSQHPDHIAVFPRPPMIPAPGVQCHRFYRVCSSNCHRPVGEQRACIRRHRCRSRLSRILPHALLSRIGRI